MGSSFEEKKRKREEKVVVNASICDRSFMSNPQKFQFQIRKLRSAPEDTVPMYLSGKMQARVGRYLLNPIELKREDNFLMKWAKYQTEKSHIHT